jgi:hypothetical protein
MPKALGFAELLPMAERDFELVEVCFPRVDGLRCVRVRTNLYSVLIHGDGMFC